MLDGSSLWFWERFGSGGVHLSAIKLLAPHLTQDNHAQLLDLSTTFGLAAALITSFLLSWISVAATCVTRSARAKLRTGFDVGVWARDESECDPLWAATARAESGRLAPKAWHLFSRRDDVGVEVEHVAWIVLCFDRR
jgi:hypothetical protein